MPKASSLTNITHYSGVTGVQRNTEFFVEKQDNETFLLLDSALGT